MKTQQYVFLEAEYLEAWIKDIPLVLGFLGGVSASYLYSEEKFSNIWFNNKITNAGRSIYTFLNRKWYFDKVYNE
jgi:NADH:ubiquinone oxidoreductase subunit 5 (subunit L)/multisubunit Na+/H+ antiporter MnhA subunit